MSPIRQRKRPKGIVRPLDPSDPRSIDHPSQRANWLALMRELGRIAAAQEWDRQHGGKMKPKRAVAYARFSNRNLQDVTSIDDQNQVCDKIAKRHNCEIVNRYRDDGVSGTGSLERDGWLALMRAAKAGEFEVVIVESLSRMSRDLADSAGFFKRLDALGIELIDLEGVANTMRVGLSGIMNQEFVKHLGNQLRRKWDGCVTKGQTPASLPMVIA